MNFTEFLKCPLNFILKFSTSILTKNYYHTSSQSQKQSTVTSQTQVCVIGSQNQQQPIVPSEQLFQHSSQHECSPVDVRSNERRPNLSPCPVFSKSLFHFLLCMKS